MATKISFHKGDFCRINYDNQAYECKVTEVEPKTIVEIIGHGVSVEMEKKNLLPSLGKSTRVKQEEDAKICNALKPGDFCRAMREGKLTEAKIWQLSEDEQGKRYVILSFLDEPNVETTVWIEGLKPQWKVGDYCRVQWAEDQVIYESEIKTLDVADGQRYAFVEFLGFGNQDSAWISDLMETQGEKSRQMQIAQALGTTVEVNVQPNSEDKKENSKAWKERDACRIVEGNVEYEGTIKSINTDGSYLVHLIGLGKDLKRLKTEVMPSAGKEARAKQRASADKEKGQPEKGTEWKVGMFCRGIFKDDGLEYEGVIKLIESTKDGQYAVVEFIGYGNRECIWLQDLLNSNGEKARQKQNKEAIGEVVVNGQDVPDAKITGVVEEMATPAEEPIQDATEKNATPSWQAEMFCRGIFKDDGLEYEGVIKSIESTEDGQYAVVEFIGYGNQECIWLQDLLNSNGEEERQKQSKEAIGEVVVNGQDVPDAKITGVTPAEEPIQDATEKNATPSWQAEMFCRGIFKDDGLEYEGVIKSIESTEDGQYAVVEFIGYGNQECIWLQDLLNSNGEEARQKQSKEAIGEVVVNGQDVPDAKITGVVEEMATPAEEPIQDATEKNATPSWQAGMFCRGIFKEDGIEYEGLVKSIESTDDGQYAVVQFIGFGNEETIWLQDLLETAGEEARQIQTQTAEGKDVVNGHVESPIKWKIGDNCRAMCSMDSTVYEGIVEELATNEHQAEYAVVRFIGYGNTDSVWPKDLIRSDGKEAREKQINEALKDVNNNKNTVETSSNISKSTPNEKSDAKEWQIDDYCRALCDFDGQEHELQIIKQNPNNKEVFRVLVLGYGHKEIKNCNVLQQSRGENARKIQINAATQPQDENTSGSPVVSPNTTMSSDSRVTVIENGDDNNNISSKVKIPDAAGDGVNWKEKFDLQSAQFDEVCKVNDHLMITLDKMEKEMFGYVRIIQELKNSFKACLSDCSTAQPAGRALVNGCL